MPLFEYECSACGKRSEVLVRDATDPPCPACGAQSLVRLLSSFAVSSEGTRAANLAAARRASAPTFKDKQVAEAEAYQKAHDDHTT